MATLPVSWSIEPARQFLLFTPNHAIGYGYHGDFIAAWDEGVLQQAVDQCTDMGGQMKSCGVFEFPENTASCTLENLPSELKDENTEGPMQGLPGGCEVQHGPEQATKGKGASGSSSGGKPTDESYKDSNEKSDNGSNGKSNGDSKVVDSSPAAAAAPVAKNKDTGAVFAQVEDSSDKGADNKDTGDKTEAPPAPATTPPTTTPPAASANAVVDGAGNVISTEIYTSGRVVYENKVVMQEVTVTQGGAKTKRTAEAKAEHVKRHGHRHHHPMQHGVGGRRMR